MIDKNRLHDKLTDAFMNYQHRLDIPFPLATETYDIILAKYRNDPLFNAKVQSMVAGVMDIIFEAEKDNKLNEG